MQIHIKGDYEEMTIAVYEDDSFSSDDFLGSVIIPTADVEAGTVNGTFELKTKEGEPAGEIRAMFSYEAGEVSFFDTLKDKLHDSDSD